MEQLKQLGIDSLKALLVTIQNLKDFTMEHAPIVLQEVLAYNLIRGYIAIVVALIAIGLCVWCIRYTVKNIDNLDGASIPMILFPGAGIIGLIIWLYSSILLVTKIHFAPRVYLIETISILIGGK